MSQAWRLPSGGRLDRGRRLRFSFDGRAYEGFAGDTLASALLANGVHLAGRSFKYHRPRGIMTAGAEEPNALVGIDRGNGAEDPNLRATQVELFDGLAATSQNRWPSLAFDIGAVGDLLSPFLPAGFYYKTFMWPPSWWTRVYEPRIRAAAGLGRSPAGPDPDRYLHRHAHCDVLVVGAGPAGLMAAATAAAAGARVILADDQPEPGGALLADAASRIDGLPALRWVGRAAEELEAMPEVTILSRASVFGYYDHNYLGILERLADHLSATPPRMPRQRLWRVRAKQVVLATGAIERPLVFGDNDRPGIMLAASARAYLNRWAVKAGGRVVLFTNNDSAYAAALDLAAAGSAVEAIVDARPDPQGPLPARAREAGIVVRAGSILVRTEGRRRIDHAWIAPADSPDVVPERVACDTLLMSGGWNPAVHLHSQARGRLRFDDRIAAFVPDGDLPAGRSAGACNGSYGLADCLGEGARAGAEAAEAAGFVAAVPTVPAVYEESASTMAPLWLAPSREPAHKVRAFVDFQNDVTAKDLKLALSEGFRSIEHVKRYTTTGMGTDQGKTSNVNALAIVADALGQGIEATGYTTFRAPYTPVTFGALAGPGPGALFDPVRKTPSHGWAEQQGAVFEDVGQWKRARYFPRAGETMQEAVARECRAARRAAGLFDASTLGKIDIRGPDAASFLDRVYTNAWSKLEVGRCRYGLMLRDDGMVLDDGVTARLGPDRFHMTTTSGNAARVFAWLEEWLQCEWPGLRVFCTSVTEQWAAIAVTGPKARDVLAAAGTDIDLSREAFPHLSWREGRVAGLPARVFRISFTGELSYEVNVASGYGAALWESLWRTGQPFGITPYGTEAMHVLRAEKGYVIVGQETDGTVTPHDLGMGRIVSRQKTDFIGKRGLARPDLVAKGRKQLVGLLTRDPAVVLEEGAQIVEDPKQALPMRMLGHVTSSYMSANLGRSIALALVAGGAERSGQTLWVPMPDGAVEIEVTPSTVFYDPKNERLDG
ncbi:MAG TPA: sarcosine oxidase subunit alpha family protein [Geminicoccaceae bacterium]|nr:sarcosine oxidase subunit alpha family protein [Geminicoccus sp.]HMU50087.1 sarcosine oxidase subunit alpha family protein [Geminicoccaceae bacterium]